MQKARTPDHPQAAVFAGPIECSYVLDDAWHAHQRLELDDDLIAAYVLTTGTVPPGWFIG
jgi:hypothetical protein